MRSKKSLLLAGLAAFVAVTFLALGCSDDDTTTPSTPTTPADNNGIETVLPLVQTQVHQYLDSIVVEMEAGLKVATFTEAGSNNDIGDLFMGGGYPDSTRTANSWIVSYLTDLGSGVGTKTIVDSIAYIVGGNLSVTAHNAEAMFARHKFNYQTSDTVNSYTDLTNHGDLHITGINTTTATVNGTFNVVVDSKHISTDSLVWNNWTIDVTTNNLTFVRTSDSWTNGCPNSGTATVNVVWERTLPNSVPTYTQWQFDITFTDGVMEADVTTGSLSATYGRTLCTP